MSERRKEQSLAPDRRRDKKYKRGVFLKLPLRHGKAVRRTNLVERSFEEERRRRKVIGGFLTEKSALKVIFTTLIKAERRWKRIPMGERDGGCKCLIIKLSLFYRKNGT